jgi:hypothetical protein
MSKTCLSRWLSPSFFALAALCFVLPFATVSCDNASTSFTGIQLVTHTVPAGGKLNEGPDCSTQIGACVERDASTTATIALAAAILGFFLGLFGVVRGPGWAALVAAGGLLALLNDGPLFGPTVDLHYGYDLALIFSACAWVLHVRRAWRRHRPGVRRGLISTQLKALGLYLLAGIVALVLASIPARPLHVTAIVAFAWIVFIVLPAWLIVDLVLGRWSAQNRADLFEHAERLDRLIVLGPFLLLYLCNKQARATLAPPRQPSPMGVPSGTGNPGRVA